MVLPGQEGLVHVSELADGFVDKVGDLVSIGDIIKVKCLGTDDRGRIRIDDWEMREDVQAAVAALWSSVNTETLEAVSDITSYREEFLGLFGFGFDGIDYDVDVNPDRPL